jgi:hypothetical protein
MRSVAKGDSRTVWGRELWHGGLGMSRSRLKDADGRKVSRSCKQHQTNLPTKDLTALGATMPVFMDLHYVEGATRHAVARAHEKDLALQDKYTVKFLTYWFDETRSMTRVTIVVFGSRSEGFRFRGASRYPTSGGSVLRFCLDPPQRSVRTSAPDLRSNLPDTDCRVDPL